MLLNSDVFQSLLQESDQCSGRNLCLGGTGLDDQRFVCERKSGMSESWGNVTIAMVFRDTTQSINESNACLPFSCRYLYIRKLISSDDMLIFNWWSQGRRRDETRRDALIEEMQSIDVMMIVQIENPTKSFFWWDQDERYMKDYSNKLTLP